MKWLHISDIHYNPKNDGRSSKQLRKKLLQYLQDNNVLVDNIFITGDFRHALLQKDEDEYSIAYASVNFIKDVAASVGIVNPEMIHIVPGNHDLTRDENFAKIKEIRGTYNHEKGNFEQEDLEYLTKRFNFFSHVNKLLHPNSNTWIDKLIPIHTYSCFEEYNLLYLNTAITCGSDNERGNLVIGNEAIYDCLESIKRTNPNKPIIVLAHHSLDNFDKGEIKALEQIFMDYPIKLYLCGDAHEAWRRITNGIMEITMGCLKNDNDVQTVFSLGELREDGEFSIEAHIWDTRFTDWAPYAHFNIELQKWALSTHRNYHTNAKIITNSRPFPVSEYFVGRDKDLAIVEKMIKESKPVVLYALPGTGKTEFCRKLFDKYANESSPFFKTIGWLFFRENIIDTFYDQFIDIQEPDIKMYWKAVKKYISKKADELLLIVDNANTLTPKDLSDLISLGCCVLLTSRGKIDRLASIPIGKLSMEECRLLYRQHGKDQTSSDETLDQIIKLADRHTLSIELLSKTQFASGKSSREMLDIIKNKGFNLSDIHEEISYTHNPEETLCHTSKNIFIEHMAKIFHTADINNLEELRILQLFSLLSTESFPLDYVKECFGVKTLNAINKLVDKGWINRNVDQSSFYMHPVVSSVIQYCANPDYQAAEPMIIWVSEKLHIQLNETPVEKMWLLSHALSIFKIFNTEETLIIAYLQNNIASIYGGQGSYSIAMEWYMKALVLCKKILDRENPFVATIYNNIGLIYKNQGNYPKALEYFFKTLVIGKEMLGEDHPSIATTYNNIALVYDHRGDYSMSLEYYHEALVIYEKVLGQNHPSIATIYNNIASIYDILGDYSEALDWFHKALHIREKILGKNHHITADTYNNMASVYDHQGDYAKALQWYRKALAVIEKVLGTDHPFWATICSNIGLVYDKLGNYSKELEWHQKALVVHEKVLGKEHPDTATTYTNIGLAYDNLEDYSEAMTWYRKSLAICEKVLGINHPLTSANYNGIAAVYYGKTDYPEAMAWYQKALAIREKVLGKEHPYTATTYNNIAILYNAQGDYPNAIKWHQKALAINEKVLDKEHPSTADIYSNIAVVYYNMGDYRKAKDWFQKALLIYDKTFGKDHPRTKHVLENMSNIIT